MSVAAAHAAAFYREVAETGRVWTIRDKAGYPGPLLARSPGLRAAWKIARPNFGGRFRDFMDGVVAGSAAAPPVNVSLEAWKVALASEASRAS